jgi:hypothetical protein
MVFHGIGLLPLDFDEKDRVRVIGSRGKGAAT